MPTTEQETHSLEDWISLWDDMLRFPLSKELTRNFIRSVYEAGKQEAKLEQWEKDAVASPHNNGSTDCGCVGMKWCEYHRGWNDCYLNTIRALNSTKPV